MSYRIRQHQSVKKSIRLIAVEQISKGISEMCADGLDRHQVVHQVRKRCKKLRGLIRLVRPQFPHYREENAYFRDAARSLSSVRDAQSLIECYDTLTKRFQLSLQSARSVPIRQQLTKRRREVADNEVDLQHRLDRFLVDMQDARQRVSSWKLQASGFDAIEGGLRKTYKRGQVAMQRAYREPNATNFHEWRKRVKYHWFHVRLLRRIWRDMLKVHAAALDELSDLLGEAHDSSLLQRTLLSESERFGPDTEMNAFAELIERRREELRRTARPLGEKVFAEKPKQLAARFRVYWDHWKC